MAKKAKTTTEPVEEKFDFNKLERPKKETSKMVDKSTILELDMNLEEYDDYEALPAGSYPATITLSEMRTSDKGNDYYYVVFTIHPDNFPADYAIENAPEGAKLTYARMQKPDSKNRRSITAIKNFMRAIGMPLKTAVINPGEWEGKKAKLTLTQGEFNGAPTNNIQAIEALD